LFGDKGKKSIMKEIANLVSRECLGEVVYENLTGKDKKFALPILTFMTRKRDGRLKSGGCVDEQQQQIWTKKEDMASPTPSQESLKYVFLQQTHMKSVTWQPLTYIANSYTKIWMRYSI